MNALLLHEILAARERDVTYGKAGFAVPPPMDIGVLEIIGKLRGTG